MTRPDLDAILPPINPEDEATVNSLLAKARAATKKRIERTAMKPDLDAIRARCDAAQVIFARNSVAAPCVYDDIPALLAYIEELTRECDAMRTESDRLRETIKLMWSSCGCCRCTACTLAKDTLHKKKGKSR